MSQVQFSRSWSQDFRTHDRMSQVRGFQFQGPGSQGTVKVTGPTVLGPRSQVSGSQDLGFQGPESPVLGLRVPGLESQVLILDYAK